MSHNRGVRASLLLAKPPPTQSGAHNRRDLINSHRAVRDDARCAEKYGADWDTYIRRVPYVFVPGLV